MPPPHGAQPAGQATFVVQCPPGVGAGMTLQANTPLGQLVTLVVPPGVPPGGQFQAVAPPVVTREQVLAEPVAVGAQPYP